MLTRIRKSCPHVNNLAYIRGGIDVHFELQILHRGFGRLDYRGASDRFLDELLAEHLDTVVFYPNFLAFSDRLIDVLADCLRGRSIRLLIMHNPYFLDHRLSQFMTSDQMTDCSYANTGTPSELDTRDLPWS